MIEKDDPSKEEMMQKAGEAVEKRPCLVVGTGGHARVVLSMLLESQGWHPRGLIDLETPQPHERILGVPVVGGKEDLEEWFKNGVSAVFIAVGDNAVRRELFNRIQGIGFQLPNLISEKASISPSAVLGLGNLVCALAHLGPLSVLGDNVIINTGTILDHESSVGSHSHLAPGVRVAGRVRIGEEAFLGIGANVIDSISIASKITIGAGATVISSLETAGTYAGIPARLIRR